MWVPLLNPYKMKVRKTIDNKLVHSIIKNERERGPSAVKRFQIISRRNKIYAGGII